jgi:2-dehydro-3-deoxygalactonokinase
VTWPDLPAGQRALRLCDVIRRSTRGRRRTLELIAINWGTTNLRAYRLDRNGAIIHERSSARGILSVEPGRFAETLYSEIRDWLALGETQILLAGMVGSRQGWKEIPYVPCPAGIEELSRNLVSVDLDDAKAVIVPGISYSDANGVPEVMRGEECEIIGIIESCGDAKNICLPGTHSKWVRIERSKIASFVTYMTGEVYAAMRDHTILSRTMRSGATNEESFHQGLRRSRDGGGLLHHLFGVRSLVIAGQMREEEAALYLSGLLIGHEVGTMLEPGSHVHLVGASALCSLYATAITVFGGTSSFTDEDAAARGLAAIGRILAWI